MIELKGLTIGYGQRTLLAKASARLKDRKSVV